MSKKIILIALIVGLIAVGIIFANSQTEVKANPQSIEFLYPHLVVTVYNYNGSTPVGGARVNLIYGGNTVLTMLSNASTGVADFNMTGQSNGTYTVTAFEPDFPNDSRSGGTTVNFSGIDASVSVNLNVFY